MTEFMTTMRELRAGGALEDLGVQLTALVAAVRETGRKGELHLKLTIKPAGKGNVDVLTVEDAVSIKRPLAEHGATILYADTDNTLTRRDPRQPELTNLRVLAERQPQAAGGDQ